ncbi:Pvc16 family protein [Streptomyces daliensis]
MIHEVDEALRLLLTEGGLTGGGVELAFDAPTSDWAARRNAPTISVFLHGIREDVARRQTGTAEEYDEDGTVTGWRTPPRWFELAYLVTTWTSRPQDEHRLLSETLRCLVAVDVLPQRLLTGTLAELGLAVSLDAGGQSERGPSVPDVWSALGGELKPSLDVRVLAPLSGPRIPAGPPVTEGMVVRTGPHGGSEESGGNGPDGGGGPVEAPGRRLRYDGATDPGSDGFAAPRERPLPSGRRRRGGARR